ncbi:MAG: RagB/SusD family nutrient uptake outer membrane protein, partial [Bacteroidales bacterium]|nr:RagB/SusD family nutrient uptake outer membrane protein [Bacteroidales bacterium]
PGPGVYDLDQDGKNDVALYTASQSKPSSSTATYIWKIGTDVFLSNGENGGYIEPYQNLVITFDDNRDYYYPIPLDELSLNPALKQNPGWDDIDRSSK